MPGEVTLLGVTQTGDSCLKLIISEGIARDEPILMNGNTSTHVEFPLKPAEYMERWFREAPTHHCAMSVGHNAGLFRKAAELMGIPAAEV